MSTFRDTWMSLRFAVEDIYRRLARIQTGPCRDSDAAAAMARLRMELDAIFTRYVLLWNAWSEPERYAGSAQREKADPVRIRLSIEDLYRRLHGIVALPDCGSTPSNNTFDCVDGFCGAVSGGPFATYQDCLDSGCSPPPPPPPPPPPGPYDCVGGNCVPSTGGAFATLQDCIDAPCSPPPPPPPPAYNCVSGDCVEAVGGVYATLADCEAGCSPPPPPPPPGPCTDAPTTVTVVVSGIQDLLGHPTPNSSADNGAFTLTGGYNPLHGTTQWHYDDGTGCGMNIQLDLDCSSGTATLSVGPNFNDGGTCIETNCTLTRTGSVNDYTAIFGSYTRTGSCASNMTSMSASVTP